MPETIEKPSTIEGIDIEQELKCDAQTCDNAAVWMRKHGPCTRLSCDECRDLIMAQIHSFDEDDEMDLWCPKCELSESTVYWKINLRWILI